jgi:radical SAM protein with 4Fe4S-binding SPASM domain
MAKQDGLNAWIYRVVVNMHMRCKFLELGYMLGIEKYLERIRFLRVPKVPSNIHIELTNHCNMNCIMCARDSLTRKKGYMDFKLFKKMVDEGCKYDFSNLQLNRYGEPLLHPGVFEMVKYAKEKGCKNVGFITNGQLLDEKKAIEAVEYGLDYIIFSIDSINKERYEKIRGAGAKFETVIENVDRLIDLKKARGLDKPRILINAVAMEMTKDEIKEMQDYWQNKVDKVNILPCYTYEDIDDLSFNKKDKKTHACEFFWKRLIVMWDGSTTVCCVDINRELNFGDVNKERIADIWNGENLKRLREIHINHEFEKLPVCNQCEFITKSFVL